jgi:hypothetical protein
VAQRHVLPIAMLHISETEGSHFVDLYSHVLTCSLIYERGDKTHPYGRKILLTDPNQDAISANCQTDEQMIIAKETA